MDDLAIIDRFTETFSRYIDSGFGLLAGDVAFLTSVLVALDITLAGLFWAMVGEDNLPAQLIRKVLYVGFFALLLNNFRHSPAGWVWPMRRAEAKALRARRSRRQQRASLRLLRRPCATPTGAVRPKAIAMRTRRTQANLTVVRRLWGAQVHGPNRRHGRATWRGGSG